MPRDPPGPRVGHRGSETPPAMSLLSKSLMVIGSTVAVASAFLLTIVFLAIGLAVALIGGGYLWWKTRDLRKQLRARMDEQAPAQPKAGRGRIIEGEAVPIERTGR